MADDESREGEEGWWDQATEGAAQAWDTVTETAGQAVDTVTETAGQAVEAVTDTAEQAWNTVTDTAEQAWDTVTDAAEQAWSSVEEAATDAAAQVVRYNWWQNLVEVTSYEGGQAVLVNIENTQPEQFDSGWSKDPEATGALSAVAGLAVSVPAMYIPTQALIARYLALLAGPAWAFWRGYEGYQIQRQVSLQVIRMHEWYGRYIHTLEGEVLAVDFAGVGPSTAYAVAGELQERLTDAEGNVLLDNEPQILDLIPMHVDYSNHTNMPEHSFGDQSLFESAQIAKSSGWGPGSGTP
jgi:hypothetical protein